MLSVMQNRWPVEHLGFISASLRQAAVDKIKICIYRVCVEYQRKNQESTPDSISFHVLLISFLYNNLGKFSYAPFCISKIRTLSSFPLKKKQKKKPAHFETWSKKCYVRILNYYGNLRDNECHPTETP